MVCINFVVIMSLRKVYEIELLCGPVGSQRPCGSDKSDRCITNHLLSPSKFRWIYRAICKILEAHYGRLGKCHEFISGKTSTFDQKWPFSLQHLASPPRTPAQNHLKFNLFSLKVIKVSLLLLFSFCSVLFSVQRSSLFSEIAALEKEQCPRLEVTS